MKLFFTRIDIFSFIHSLEMYCKNRWRDDGRDYETECFSNKEVTKRRCREKFANLGRKMYKYDRFGRRGVPGRAARR